SKGTIIINDPKLSSTHCEFKLEGLRIFITDLGSTNGVFINGNKIEKNAATEIKLEDKLLLGSITYVVGDSEQLLVKNQSDADLPPVKPTFKDVVTFFGISRRAKALTEIGILAGCFCTYFI